MTSVGLPNSPVRQAEKIFSSSLFRRTKLRCRESKHLGHMSQDLNPGLWIPSRAHLCKRGCVLEKWPRPQQNGHTDYVHCQWQTPPLSLSPSSLTLELLTSFTLRFQELDVFLISGLSVFTQKNDEFSSISGKQIFLVLSFEITPLQITNDLVMRKILFRQPESQRMFQGGHKIWVGKLSVLA